jgi:hypothetical protein
VKRLFPYQYLGKRLNIKTADLWQVIRYESTRDVAAMNLAGKYPTRHDEEGYPLPRNGYIAVLAVDGDKMGERASCCGNPKEYADFGRRLTEFANDVVPGVIGAKGGQVIYAGGDDIVAMLSADGALACARELRAALKKQAGEDLDVSAGIAVGHYMHPLQDLVHEAHAALNRAKTLRGRSAVELSLLKRGGEDLEWGAKWDSPALALYEDFVRKTYQAGDDNAPHFSGGFASELAALLAPYKLREQKTLAPQERLDESFLAVVEADFRRVEERQSDPAGKLKLPAAAEYLAELKSRPEHWQDFSSLFLVAAFMNRKTEVRK